MLFKTTKTTYPEEWYKRTEEVSPGGIPPLDSRGVTPHPGSSFIFFFLQKSKYHVAGAARRLLLYNT
jgi:hypothetical protein